jgi:hypothetical protein
LNTPFAGNGSATVKTALILAGGKEVKVRDQRIKPEQVGDLGRG